MASEDLFLFDTPRHSLLTAKAGSMLSSWFSSRGSVRLAFLIGSDPATEGNRHQAASSNRKGLEDDHRDLDLGLGQRRKAGEHDIREGDAHGRSLGGDAISHRDRVCFAKPEYGKRKADGRPKEIVGYRDEYNEDDIVRLYTRERTGFKGLVKSLPDDCQKGQ